MADAKVQAMQNGVYPDVELTSSRWLVALIRESLRTWEDAGLQGVPSPEEVPQARGRDLLLASLGREVAGVAELSRMCGSSSEPGVVRLTAAAVLAGAAGDLDAVDELMMARRSMLAGGPAPAERLGKWLGKVLGNASKTLRANLLGDDHPLLDTPYHRALLAIDRRLCDRLAGDLVSGHLDRQRLGEQLARARSTRLAFAEVVVGLVWADGRPTSSEIRLVNTLIGIGGYDSGERELLKRALGDGALTLDQVARDIPDHDDRVRLLETLAMAAFIDGNFTADERAYIDRVAAAFELDADDMQAVDLRVAEQLARDPRLLALLHSRGRITQRVKDGHGTIDRLVRRNLSAIRDEIWQTGDLMALLARSMRGPLTADENKRMRGQLIDLCKAVPALALFAAPGGSLLLPVLARVLPFSLAPSSFQDAEETVF